MLSVMPDTDLPRHPQHRFLVAATKPPAAAVHPLGPPPSVLAAARAADPHLAWASGDESLAQAVARVARTSPDRVVVAASADALLGALCQLLLVPGDRVALAGPAPPDLLRALLLVGARYVDVGRDAAFSVQLPFLQRVLDDGDVGLTALGRPCPVTGVPTPEAALAAALESGGHVLLDRRHAAFADALPTVRAEGRGLIVLDGLAASAGLGPLGVAWMLVEPDLAELLRGALPSRGLSCAAVAAALVALGSAHDEVTARANHVSATRAALQGALRELPGWQVVDGQGLSVLVRYPGAPASEVAAMFQKAGLVVAWDLHPSWRDAVRITVPGDAAQIPRWVAAAATLPAR